MFLSTVSMITLVSFANPTSSATVSGATNTGEASAAPQPSKVSECDLALTPSDADASHYRTNVGGLVHGAQYGYSLNADRFDYDIDGRDELVVGSPATLYPLRCASDSCDNDSLGAVAVLGTDNSGDWTVRQVDEATDLRTHLGTSVGGLSDGRFWASAPSEEEGSDSWWLGALHLYGPSTDVLLHSDAYWPNWAADVAVVDADGELRFVVCGAGCEVIDETGTVRLDIPYSDSNGHSLIQDPANVSDLDGDGWDDIGFVTQRSQQGRSLVILSGRTGLELHNSDYTDYAWSDGTEVWIRPNRLTTDMQTLIAVPDRNGDGISELVLTGTIQFVGDDFELAAVLDGSDPNTVLETIPMPDSFRGTCGAYGMRRGGDIDRDGVEDLLVGRVDDVHSGICDHAGFAWAISGATGAVLMEAEGDQDGEDFGYSMTSADFDGDGILDVAISSPHTDLTVDGGSEHGRVLAYESTGSLRMCF